MYTQTVLCANPKGKHMKHAIAIVATVVAATAFAADTTKAPVATPAVTKADAPVVKEVAKEPAHKSNKNTTAKDAKKSPEAATPTAGAQPAATVK
jgi:hypothetical protein